MRSRTVPHHHDWTNAQQTIDVTVDGHTLTIAYYEAGADNDGPPLAFLHGIPTWSFLWRDIAPALADDYHVIAPDLAGYGNSAHQDGFDRSIRFQEQMLAELFGRLSITDVNLVGHDIGGGVALRYAWHNPNEVSRLVLSNATCYDSWPVEFINSLGLPQTVQNIELDELDAKLDFAFSDGLYSDEPNEEFNAGMKYPWRDDSGRTSLRRCAVATNTNHTTEIEYEAITADTLLLWGSDDVLQPVSYAERLASDLHGDIEFVKLDDAYHWVTEDRTDAYRNSLRQFVSSHDGN